MGIRKGFLWVAVAILMATVYLLYEPPQPASTQTPGPVNATAEVSAEQCAPCHLQIAGALKPGLIFDHGMHLMVACSACHYQMPHEGGKTYAPPMEACFNCHGISHGPQGQLAKRECSACHTKSFNLRPSTHTKDYAGKPHSDRAKLGVNSCLMCHNDPVKDCDTCHVKQGVKVDGKPVGPMPKAYVPITPMKVKKPSVMIYPQGTTTMGQCIYCHPDLDNFGKGKVIFQHAEHLRRDFKCTVCHPTFPHGAETISRPPMETCYKCHGLVHAAGGLIATDQCNKCHPAGFDLKPQNHTPEFVAGGHKARASDDQAYCAMCHKLDFCVTCHQGRKLLTTARYSKQVIPSSHKRADWRSKHGGLYLQQKGACAACHDSQSCTTCHYTPMPHPTDWVQKHGKQTHAIAESQRDCNVCHTNREQCQGCHHDKVKRAELKPQNCTPCHSIMNQTPWTSIKNKGMAEHAVHFIVKKKKGAYYTCDDCHVGFGTGGAASQKQADLSQGGHDVRLCYGCHGALDYENKLIAPYSGAELCLRCHQNLNI